MHSAKTGVKKVSLTDQRSPRAFWRRLRLPRGAAFFALFFVYFAIEIDVRLLYHCCGLIDNFPSFYRGWDFFHQFLTYPGGIVAYLSALLAQSFYYTWLGAAVVTGQAWAICWYTDSIITAFGGRSWRGLRFLGPLLLLAIYSQYGFHFPTTIGFLVALMATCLYLTFTPKGALRAGLLFAATSTVLYVAAGGPSLLFTLLCVLYEVLCRRRLVLGLVELAIGAALPCVVGVLLYRVRAHDAYFELLPLSWKITGRDASQIMLKAVYVLYLFLPVAAGMVGLGRLISVRRQKSRVAGKKVRQTPKPSFIKALLDRIREDRSHGAVGLNVPTLVLVAAVAGTLLLYRDPALRRIFRVDYLSRQRQWNRVIEIGRRSPYHYLICHAVSRALFQTGQLGDALFEFPQKQEALFLTRPGTEALWQKVDTCMDIGLLNQSENAAAICVETFGERPLLLQRLATINMAKGNISTARVFLHALEKVPFWGAAARDRLVQLERDPNCVNDAPIQQLRRVMLKTDFVGNADTLTLLLTENPANRMAYEYGMASLLLSKNLDDFEKIFNRYHRLNETRLPRHYAEALLLSRVLKKQPLDVPGQTIAQEMKLKLHEFFQALQTKGKEQGTTKEKLRAALKDTYGHTYYYYYFLGS